MFDQATKKNIELKVYLTLIYRVGQFLRNASEQLQPCSWWACDFVNPELSYELHLKDNWSKLELSRIAEDMWSVPFYHYIEAHAEWHDPW